MESGSFEADVCRRIVLYLRISVFRIVCLPPLANVPAQHSSPRAVTIRQMILDTC